MMQEFVPVGTSITSPPPSLNNDTPASTPRALPFFSIAACKVGQVAGLGTTWTENPSHFPPSCGEANTPVIPFGTAGEAPNFCPVKALTIRPFGASLLQLEAVANSVTPCIRPLVMVSTTGAHPATPAEASSLANL